MNLYCPPTKKYFPDTASCEKLFPQIIIKNNNKISHLLTLVGSKNPGIGEGVFGFVSISD